jgi:hypothetical protein
VKRDQKSCNRYLGGVRPPFGLQLAEGGELVRHEGEQKAIRHMRPLRAQGRSLSAISEAVQAQGHRISYESVATVLRAAEP